MICIVQKYGGSSVADVDKLRQIADLIALVRRQENQVAVVVSAMGKTTDNLLSMARELSPKPPRREMDMLQTLKLMDDFGISVNGLTTTSFRISLLVPRERVNNAVQICHDHWIS